MTDVKPGSDRYQGTEGEIENVKSKVENEQPLPLKQNTYF